MITSKSPSRTAAAVRSLAIILAVALDLGPGAAIRAHAASSDGISTAIEIETDDVRGPQRRFEETAEAQVRPHWCNDTGKLVEDIHRKGGESVVRLELDGGRALERYWNASEEVVIEHGSDGTSCLVEVRPRRQAH